MTDIAAFIAEREREECLASPDPDIPQDEWEQAWSGSFTFAVQQLSVALRRVVFAFGEAIPQLRKDVRRHAAKWRDHDDYDPAWSPEGE